MLRTRLLLIVVLLFGWKWCHKGTSDIYVYLVGVLIAIMVTSTFPWQWFKSTPLAIIQFPCRYTSFAACFLAIIGAIGLTSLVTRVPRKYMTGILITIALFSLCLGETYTLVARNHNSDGSVEVLKGNRHGQYKTLRSASDTPIIITNKTIMINLAMVHCTVRRIISRNKSSDSAKTVLNRHAYMDGHQIKFSQHSKPNQLIYVVNAKKAGLVDLPALVYSHSLVTVNNNRQAVKASSRVLC